DRYEASLECVFAEELYIFDITARGGEYGLKLKPSLPEVLALLLEPLELLEGPGNLQLAVEVLDPLVHDIHRVASFLVALLHGHVVAERDAVVPLGVSGRSRL